MNEWFRRSNISMDIKITEHLAKGNKNGKKSLPAAYHGFKKHLRKDIQQTTGTSNLGP